VTSVKLPRLTYSPYRSEYDEEFMASHGDKYERRTPWTRMRLANVQELVDPQPGDRVLDLGCAAGSMAHFLSAFGCEAIGCDDAPTAINEARRRYPELRFDQADCANLPYDDETFDKLLAADLTEHLVDSALDGMVRESFRVLRGGGSLSIHTPNPRHFIERLKARGFLLEQNPTHIGLRTREDLETHLRAAGFGIELSMWRRSFIPVFRSFETLAGLLTELFRYRICIRARKPASVNRRSP
jgi:SAM-dependent methyltransferase